VCYFKMDDEGTKEIEIGLEKREHEELRKRKKDPGARKKTADKERGGGGYYEWRSPL